MQIVHVQTTVQTTFGVVDADGDTDLQSVTLSVKKLTAEEFDKLLASLLEAKAKLAETVVPIGTAGE